MLKWQVLRPIEAEVGRVRGPDRYAPRTIDLDLLAYDLLEAALWIDVRRTQDPRRGLGTAPLAAWSALRRQRSRR